MMGGLMQITVKLGGKSIEKSLVSQGLFQGLVLK
jgi:hypothetical protein